MGSRSAPIVTPPRLAFLNWLQTFADKTSSSLTPTPIYTTHFNDLRRGLPRMSPTLLSKRLKELEQAGVIAQRRTGRGGGAEYELTEAGKDLRGVIMSLGL